MEDKFVAVFWAGFLFGAGSVSLIVTIFCIVKLERTLNHAHKIASAGKLTAINNQRFDSE